MCDPKTVREPFQTPSVLDPIFGPKCLTLRDPSYHRPAHPVVPVGLTHAFHILQPTLKKMVTDKVIKGPQILIGDMIELEDLSSNIIVARNERDDYMPALLE